MKFSKKDKYVIRTTPRGTHADTVVVIHPPKERKKHRSPKVCTHCSECGGRVSYKSPSWLCQGCRAIERMYHHSVMALAAEEGSPYWNFYLAPTVKQSIKEAGEEFQKVAADLKKSAQASEASYTPLYS